MISVRQRPRGHSSHPATHLHHALHHHAFAELAVLQPPLTPVSEKLPDALLPQIHTLLPPSRDGRGGAVENRRSRFAAHALAQQ